MSKARELAELGAVYDSGALSNRNVIINGAMQVAQRGTSSTDIGGSFGYFVCDRWRSGGGSTAGRLTMTQESDGPSGFANCTKLACTTADTSIAAGENLNFQQIIEGQDLQRICKGTSDAKELTFSFYVKGNAAATYTVELFDANNSRQISKTFSVTTAWTRVSLTYPADTTGAFTDSNAAALYIIIWLHAGSTYTSGTLNSTSWAANVEANRVSGSQTSFLDSTSRTFFITGVQLEVGTEATPFEHRSVGQELALCQRYYAKIENTVGSEQYFGLLQAYVSSSVYGIVADYPEIMRATPTVAQSGTFKFALPSSSDAGGATTIGSLAATSRSWLTGGWGGGSGLTAGHASVVNWANGAYLTADAEL